MRRIAIIIINFNNTDDTISCLESLQKVYFKSLVCEIYLIDNGSKHKISNSELYQFNNLSIKLFNLNHNYGFAEGNNIGINEAHKKDFDYYILLNNDTELVDDSIERLVSYMDSNPEVGIGGLVNYYFSAPDTIWQAGAKFLYERFDYRQIQVIDKRSDVFTEVDYVPGSSFFIKKEVIDKIGLLDANYFAYREEADYCWRAKEAGFKVGFLPNTRILHKVGKSSTSFLKQYLRFRNELYFCSKFGKNKDKIIVYARIFKRTIKLLIQSRCDCRVIKVTVIAVKDFRNSIFGYGSIDKVM